MNAAELLGLNSDIVRNRARAYKGYAAALARTENADVTPAVLSHYNAIAAGYWASVDGLEASKCFLISARYALTQANQSLEATPKDLSRFFGWRLRASLLAACSGNYEFSRQVLESESLKYTSTPDGLLSGLLATVTAVLFTEDSKLRETLRLLMERALPQRDTPTGVLQIPLHFVTSLVELARDPQGKENPAVQEWVVGFSARLSERIALAQKDRSHWLELNTRLLPIEPEALLAVLIWRKLAKREETNAEFERILNHLPMTLRAYELAASDIQKSSDTI